MNYLLAIFIAFQASLSAATTTLSGQVVEVYDGDTLTLQTDDGKKHSIRFEHIDAPEVNPKQDYGTDSRDALRALVLNKNVTVRVSGQDQYNRNLGVVYLGKGGGWTINKSGQWMKIPSLLKRKININLEMAAKGHAWHYKDYSNEQQYSTAETRARMAKIGLWSGSNPTAPWVFRQQNKQQVNSSNNLNINALIRMQLRAKQPLNL